MFIENMGSHDGLYPCPSPCIPGAPFCQALAWPGPGSCAGHLMALVNHSMAQLGAWLLAKKTIMVYGTGHHLELWVAFITWSSWLPS